MTKLSLAADDPGGVPLLLSPSVATLAKPKKKTEGADEGPKNLAEVFKGQRKWNVPLALLFLGLSNCWYVRHWAPSALVVTLTNAALLVPGGILSTLGGAILEDLGKWWNRVVEDEKKHLTRFLCAGCVVAGILNAVTSSITLRASTGGLRAIIEGIDSDRPLEISAEAPEAHGTKRFFFRTKPQLATIRLVEPHGFEPLQKEFGRWGALDLAVPESFSEKRFHLVELVGWPGLITRLPEESDATPAIPYELWVRPVEGGAGAIRLSGDLRRGLFLVGAAKTDIDKVAAAETAAVREDNLRRLARELGATPTTEEEVRSGWITQPRHLIATPEYAPGTRLEFTVRRQGQTIAICTATISENDASDIHYFLLRKP